MKRFLDLILSCLLIILCLPILLLIWIFVFIESKGKPIYNSFRIGKNEKIVSLYKFRTMKVGSDNFPITIGNKDPRITKLGYYLRKYKLDELPQLFNILRGELSFVGPRADVEKYISEYKKHYQDYFLLKPGLTGYSSLFLIEESEIYTNKEFPEFYYINHIIPLKVKYAKYYQENHQIGWDIFLIIRTIKEVIKTMCLDGKNLVIQPSHVRQRKKIC